MSKEAPYYRLAARAFVDFSGTIAVPAVIAAMIGKRLDSKYATEPWILIIALIVAFVLTAVIVVKKAKRYRADYEKLILWK
jgi:F0F1-type ATP synthase assembly protein I